jgi:hypothetical protein
MSKAECQERVAQQRAGRIAHPWARRIASLDLTAHFYMSQHRARNSLGIRDDIH